MWKYHQGTPFCSLLGKLFGTARVSLPNFVPVEALGLPGYWVHSITVDDTFPVELMSFGVQ